MRYTFGQAEAFYWVARLGGFRAAAQHLNLSQPTVSLRIKELERILGGELFDRSLYRPVPTTLGNAIYVLGGGAQYSGRETSAALDKFEI